MKIAVTMTTYKRQKHAYSLLDEVARQLNMMGADAEFCIVDDGSPGNANHKIPAAFPYPYDIIQSSKNLGKKGHWQLVNKIFRWLEARDFDYALYLQDDLFPHSYFTEQLFDMFESIDDPEKVCLNYVVEQSRNRIKCWTPLQPTDVSYNGYDMWKVGWTELHFLANRRFFQALGWQINPIKESRWNRNKHMSSGVGQQISERLYEGGSSMYQVTRSLASHGHAKSLMNPEERKRNPLRSV